MYVLKQGGNMAVLIEGMSVVLMAYAVERKYPGGLARFREDLKQPAMSEDGELVCINLGNDSDVFRLVEFLTESGFSMKVDMITATQYLGMEMSCVWAECGIGFWDGDPLKYLLVCRLTGSVSRAIATPPGWNYHLSASRLNGVPVHLYKDGFSCRVLAIPAGQRKMSSPPVIKPDTLPGVYADGSPRLTTAEACRIVGHAFNSLDASQLKRYLAGDVIYYTDSWLHTVKGKKEVLEYIGKLFDAYRSAQEVVFAELAGFMGRPCLVVAEKDRANPVLTLHTDVWGGKIARIGFVKVPGPNNCERTGIYP
jgi:hypothetical protein